MAEAWGTGRPTTSADRRMWRRLLASLHPDAGGDPELFLFASSVKDQVCKPDPPKTGTAYRGTGADPFLRAWRDTLSSWATSNRDALKVHRSGGRCKRR